MLKYLYPPGPRETRDSLLDLQTDPAKGQWLVYMDKGRLFLRPVGAVLLPEASKVERAIEVKVGELGDRLTDIARAQNLIGIAAAAANGGGDTLGITADLVKFPESAPRTLETAIPITWSDRGLVLTAGDWVSVRIHNDSLFPVWVTCLFVDSNFGIHAFYPTRNTGRTQNRIAPGSTFLTPAAKVTTKTFGLEHMVVIAVKARNDADEVDFTCLCEPTLEEAKAGTRGAPDLTLDSPLGRLFQTALYAQGTTRSFSRASLDDCGIRLISFRTQDKRDVTPPIPTKTRAAPEATPSAHMVVAPAVVPAEAAPTSWMPVVYVVVGVLCGGVAVLLVNRRRVAK